MKARRAGIDFHVAGGIYQGVKTYLENLIAEMLKISGELHYFVYTDHKDGFASWKDVHDHLTLKDLPTSSGRLNLLFGFPACAYRDRLALFHSQYVLPIYLPCKSVLTIHDILFESHPEFFPRFHRALMKYFVPLSAKRAHRIIAVSEFTKQEIVKYYRVPAEKIIVTYEGVSSGFVPIADEHLKSRRLKEYGILSKYLLFVGRIEPRKNIVGILKAFKHLKEKGHEDVTLVVVGHQDKIFRERDLKGEIEKLGLQSEIIFTGGVSERDLCILYNRAEALVYPAFAEGFGLPVVEAMACGTPVITSSTTALREVGEGGALFVDPYSHKEIAQALEQILLDDDLRKRLSFKGLKRSQEFRWEKTARATVDVYRQVLAL